MIPLLLLPPPAAAAPGDLPLLETVEVRAVAAPEWAGAGGYAGTVFEAEELQAAPRRRLDDVLRASPGFRLFRRSGSGAAHPTTQGASLRNVGPSGAGRTEVLLDGVPVGDPFGGWVPWSRLTPLSVGRVSLVRDGGVNPWGSSTLGGAVAIEPLHRHRDRYFTGEVAAGSALDFEATALFARELTGDEGGDGGGIRGRERAPAQVFGGVHHSRSSGYPVVRDSQRGAVDTDAGLESEWVQFGGRAPLGHAGWTAGAEVAAFAEERGNGTPLAVNSTRGLDWNLRLERGGDGDGDGDGDGGPGGGGRAELIFFRQERTFESRFTAVDAGRATERPVLDQTDVPAEATGLIVRVRPAGDGGPGRATFGFDARRAEGSTEERFRNLGAGFTRWRRAGGRQFRGGLFALGTWNPGGPWEASAAGRADFFKESDGRRTEVDTTTGTTTRQERFPDRERTELGGRLGVRRRLGERAAARAALYSGVRQPTLNELYRPFRVGNDITEANPALDPERIYGVEVGVEARPHEAFEVAASVFYNRLQDPVANVTLLEAPAAVTQAPWGFIPAGGSGRQRLNLGGARTGGVEVEGRWRITPSLAAEAGYLWTETEVTDSPDQPALEGKRLAQVPRHQARLGLSAQAGERADASVEFRWSAEQFEDDLNRRRLDPFLTVDLGLRFRPREGLEVFAALENATDEEVQTRVDGGGTVFVGAPRTWTAGVRWSF